VFAHHHHQQQPPDSGIDYLPAFYLLRLETLSQHAECDSKWIQKASLTSAPNYLLQSRPFPNICMRAPPFPKLRKIIK
jgi:hypothetical protein